MQGVTRFMQGFFIFRQGLDEELNSLERLSIEASHVLFRIGHAAHIEKSQNKGMENGKSLRSSSFTNVTSIFSESDISTVRQAIFNEPLFTDEFE